MKKEIETSPTGTVYAKFNGELTSDVPLLVQLDSKEPNVSILLEENAVYDKVVFRGNVAGNGSALVRKSEQRADIHLEASTQGRVFLPRWATFELDVVHENEFSVGSLVGSAIAGFFGLRYPYLEIHRRSVLRDKTKFYAASEVAMDDGKLVFVRPAASVLHPKPVVFSRGRETEIIESYRRKEKILNGISGGTGIAGVGLLLAYFIKNSGN